MNFRGVQDKPCSRQHPDESKPDHAGQSVPPSLIKSDLPMQCFVHSLNRWILYSLYLSNSSSSPLLIKIVAGHLYTPRLGLAPASPIHIASLPRKVCRITPSLSFLSSNFRPKLPSPTVRLAARFQTTFPAIRCSCDRVRTCLLVSRVRVPVPFREGARYQFGCRLFMTHLLQDSFSCCQW